MKDTLSTQDYTTATQLKYQIRKQQNKSIADNSSNKEIQPVEECNLSSGGWNGGGVFFEHIFSDTLKNCNGLIQIHDVAWGSDLYIHFNVFDPIQRSDVKPEYLLILIIHLVPELVHVAVRPLPAVGGEGLQGLG